MKPAIRSMIALAALVIATPSLANAAAWRPVPATAVAQDSLIRPGENHFAHLWQLTFGGENAEGYWSADDHHLIFQSTRDGWPCDQEFVMDLTTGTLVRVSTGKGRCTCGYFYDNDRRVLFASTHAGGDSCPPLPDYSQGYVWPLYPTYDIWTAKPDGSDLQRLTDHDGYDAEATLSTDGKWIVFTSVRDGDVDLYKMHPDGSELTRLTSEPGYDGGAYFSRDGKWICWRRDELGDSASTAEFRRLLGWHLVKPTHMNLWVMRADGTGKKQVTRLPGASFAPYFTPDGKRLIFSSNYENPRGRNFDLYLVDVNGSRIEPVTRDETFDSFPMFNRDGHWLVFASNRGARVRGETNLFLVEWRP